MGEGRGEERRDGGLRGTEGRQFARGLARIHPFTPFRAETGSNPGGSPLRCLPFSLSRFVYVAFLLPSLCPSLAVFPSLPLPHPHPGIDRDPIAGLCYRLHVSREVSRDDEFSR